MNFVPVVIVFMMPFSYLTFGQFVEFYRNHKADNSIDYSFRYYIDSPLSGVTLDHWEDRRGDHVTGRYGLLEPGGFVRTVYYDVNGNSGFRSAVRIRTPGGQQHQIFYHGKSLQQPKMPVRFSEHKAIATLQAI